MTVRQTFWSRRKQAVEAEARQETDLRLCSEEAEAMAVQDQKDDSDLLEELGLPDPDTLQAGDDFSAFMSKSVPARLRNRALRKLWVSNPVLANLDGLVDYAEDFRTAELSGEVIQTTYQVGKGLMKHVEELARLQEQKEGAVETSAVEEAPVEEIEEMETEEVANTEARDASDHEMEVVEMADATPIRRMRFVVEAST